MSRRVSLIQVYYALGALLLAIIVQQLTGMIAFTGVVFSLVLLAVQFGRSQYSPRLTPYLLQDPVIRHAVGTFSACCSGACRGCKWQTCCA